MNNSVNWVRTTIVVGLASILPIILLAWVIYWLYRFILAQVEPIAELISLGIKIDIVLSSLITVAAILVICFLLGLFVRTRAGNFFHEQVEKRILKKIPGYTVTKEVVLSFSGEQETPFSAAVLCRPFGGNVWMTGFVTDRTRSRNIITIFVPTGPNPTSGNIYHLPQTDVIELKGKVEQGIKTVIGCGTGSNALIEDSELNLKDIHTGKQVDA